MAADETAQREQVAKWIFSLGLATGHGDTLEDLLSEAAPQIRELQSSEQFYRRRCEELQLIQNRMRDPERQMVCDILANGIPRDKAGIGEYPLTIENGQAVRVK